MSRPFKAESFVAEHVRGIPRSLSALCQEMIARAPEQRPTGPDFIARLRSAIGDTRHCGHHGAVLDRTWNAHADGQIGWQVALLATAFVTRALSASTDGEVTYLAADGAQYAIPARSFDGSPLEVGDEVIIDRIEDGVAWVEAWAVVEKRI